LLRSPNTSPVPYTTLFRSRRVSGLGNRLLHLRRDIQIQVFGPGSAGTHGARSFLTRRTYQIVPALSALSQAIGRWIPLDVTRPQDRKSTRLNSSHVKLSYA